MNLVKEAIDLGFSNAAVMDTKKLVFVPEYRNFCEENRCGCYNLNPACPPSCGTAEEMKQRAFRYKILWYCRPRWKIAGIRLNIRKTSFDII